MAQMTQPTEKEAEQIHSLVRAVQSAQVGVQRAQLALQALLCDLRDKHHVVAGHIVGADGKWFWSETSGAPEQPGK